MNKSTGRDLEAELMRRVAYLPGGKTQSGLPLIVVPIDTPPSGLCGTASTGGPLSSSLSPGSSGTSPSTTLQSPTAIASANKELLNESFDSCAARLGRSEEEHCRDLDRVLRYLLPIAT